MKAHPILFSAPMVRALLDGTKTQTRRAVKPQPDVSDWKGIQSMFGFAGGDRSKPFGDWHQWRVVGPDYPDDDSDDVWCPWAAGELAWVRETWGDVGTYVRYKADEKRALGGYGAQRWRPSIHMPRSASRLTLRITEVRVLRLQEISADDALAEGIIKVGARWEAPSICATPDGAVGAYRCVWEYINGQGSWAANPWVWALTFEVIQKNVTEVLEHG